MYKAHHLVDSYWVGLHMKGSLSLYSVGWIDQSGYYLTDHALETCNTIHVMLKENGNINEAYKPIEGSTFLISVKDGKRWSMF